MFGCEVSELFAMRERESRDGVAWGCCGGCGFETGAVHYLHAMSVGSVDMPVR